MRTLFCLFLLFSYSPLVFSYDDAFNFETDTNQVKFDWKASYGVMAKGPQSATVSAEVLAVLKKHRHWQSNSFLKLPGLFVTSSPRVWSYVEKKGHPFLKERTKMTIGMDCNQMKPTSWTSVRIDLLSAIDTDLFTTSAKEICPDDPVKQPQNLTFSILSEDRILVLPVEDLGIGFILFPYVSGKSVQGNWKGREVGNLAVSPWGFSATEQQQASIPIPLERSIPLHHDLTSTLPVLVDPSVPNFFMSDIVKVIRHWNAQLGARVFDAPVASSDALTEFDCLSLRRLCIKWEGPVDVSWIGLGGIALSNHDPLTGSIIGGQITISNNLDEPITDGAITSEIRQYLNEKTTFESGTKMYSQRIQLKPYRHLQPSWEFSQVLSHEMGHFNGFRHNFEASIKSRPGQIASVMDYVPFSFSYSTSYQLGKLDEHLLSLIYEGEDLPLNYRLCMDGEVTDRQTGLPPRQPNCNQWDFGASQKWFIELAKDMTDGVFAQHPKYPTPLVDFLSGFVDQRKVGVSRTQRKEVKDFLCSQSSEVLPRIIERLKNQQVELSCNLSALD